MAQAGAHLDDALRLLQRGIVCLPLQEGGKHLDLAAMGYDPLHRRTMRKDLKELAFTGIAFHLSQRPPDKALIERWFRGLRGNVGILGGFCGLLILDFDDAEAYRRWRALHEDLVRSTPVARTPAGFHVYLRSSEPIVSSSLHFGLRRVGHVKSLGGYVVGSPSRLEDGCAYNWLPGQTPFDLEPREVGGLASLSLRPVSFFKQCYDRARKRGFFEERGRPGA